MMENGFLSMDRRLYWRTNTEKNYELWLWLLGENLTSRSLWSCDLSSDTRQTPFLQQVFHEVCVSLIKIGFLCLLSVIVFKGGLGIGNFNKHPTISSNAVGKLAKTQQWSHFTFRSSHPRAFSKLFVLGITKGANRGRIYIYCIYNNNNNHNNNDNNIIYIYI